MTSGKSYSGKEANSALCKPLSNPGIYGKKTLNIQGDVQRPYKISETYLIYFHIL